MTKKQIGYLGESLAQKHLIQNNYLILAKNYTIRGGEIDLITKDKLTQEIVFIEVKTRSSNYFGYPEQAVNFSKKQYLQRTAEKFLQDNNYSAWQNFRFDIISVELDFKIRKAKIRQFKCI